MSSLRIVLADEPRPARLAVRSILDSFPDVRDVAEAASGPEALELVERLRPDLVLLGVPLPRLDAFDVVRRMPREARPQIAFLGKSERHALEAFDVGALDYLLKPVQAARLRETLDRARERMGAAGAASGKGFDRLPIRVAQEILLVPFDQIASIVADGDLLHVTTVRNERHTLSSHRLKHLETRLEDHLFVRLSRGVLANARLISKLSPLANGNYLATLANRQELPVSRAQARALRERLFGL